MISYNNYLDISLIFYSIWIVYELYMIYTNDSPGTVGVVIQVFGVDINTQVGRQAPESDSGIEQQEMVRKGGVLWEFYGSFMGLLWDLMACYGRFMGFLCRFF